MMMMMMMMMRYPRGWPCRGRNIKEAHCTVTNDWFIIDCAIAGLYDV